MAAEALARLTAALAGRYTIERELGRGGNATVYLAHDLKHDRKVALKVLSPELALSVRTERFLREIQIAAQLTHPHILPLYDSGHAGESLYYVMPYVTGESLRDRLQREPQLPLEDALAIARDIADALDHAHRAGVVHRDIKPENILLPAGHAVVMDFGIARALTVAGGAETVTQTGVAVGTPLYMSPEQASGGETVDGRSDVYSLGCVVYEMLAGHPPFTGATAQEVLARHALDPVPTLEAARPGVPAGMAQAVTRALAKRPADRWKTAAEFAAAVARPGAGTPARRGRLRLLSAGAALAALVAGVALVTREFLGRAPPQQSVAVLPFVNLSAEPESSEYFSDGITEELINGLVQVGGLRVPARTSSFAFKGKNPDIRDIGRALNVAHVLEGSVRREGDSVRITAQLINVADGYHVWSATYDRELRGVLTLQEDIARAIVGALEVRLRGAQAAVLARRSTENPEAYDLYLRGRYFWNQRTPENITKAIDYFHRAIAEDSGYALAYSGMADAYVLAGYYGYLAREQSYPQARAAAMRAVSLDESLAEAHTSLARVYQNYDWDWRGAEREYRRAIALNPRYALARTWYGMLLARGLARSREGIREATIGHELDPLSPWANNNLSVVMNHARRHDDAIKYARRAIELAPDWEAAHGQLAQAYRWNGRFEEALVEYETAARLGGGHRRSAVGQIYARTGRRAEALEILRQLEQQSGREKAWVQLAALHGALGDADRAFQALDSAVATRAFSGEPTLAANPDWDPLRSDPRFARLLRQVGLAR